MCLHLAVNNAEHKNCIFVFVSALNRRKQQIALLPVSVQGHNRLFKFSSVQFKLVSMSSEKSICTPPVPFHFHGCNAQNGPEVWSFCH